jgi:hypothetical protein
MERWRRDLGWQFLESGSEVKVTTRKRDGERAGDPSGKLDLQYDRQVEKTRLNMGVL